MVDSQYLLSPRSRKPALSMRLQGLKCQPKGPGIFKVDILFTFHFLIQKANKTHTTPRYTRNKCKKGACGEGSHEFFWCGQGSKASRGDFSHSGFSPFSGPAPHHKQNLNGKGSHTQNPQFPTLSRTEMGLKCCSRVDSGL